MGLAGIPVAHNQVRLPSFCSHCTKSHSRGPYVVAHNLSLSGKKSSSAQQSLRDTGLGRWHDHSCWSLPDLAHKRPRLVFYSSHRHPCMPNSSPQLRQGYRRRCRGGRNGGGTRQQARQEALVRIVSLFLIESCEFEWILRFLPAIAPGGQKKYYFMSTIFTSDMKIGIISDIQMVPSLWKMTYKLRSPRSKWIKNDFHRQLISSNIFNVLFNGFLR